MYIDKALERLNQIEWSKIGTKGDEHDTELCAEFTRRLAHYFKKINMEDIHPPMYRLFNLFDRGDFNEDMESYKHSTFTELEAEFPQLFEQMPKYSHFVKRLALSCLQMARDIDNGEADPDDLELFEPVWIIFQRGGLIFRGEGSSSAIQVLNGAFFPISKGSWNVDRVHSPLNYKPLDLSKYKTE